MNQISDSQNRRPACHRCNASKLRCTRARGQTECKRCLRAQIECRPRPSRRGKQARTTVAGAAPASPTSTWRRPLSDSQWPVSVSEICSPARTAPAVPTAPPTVPAIPAATGRRYETAGADIPTSGTPSPGLCIDPLFALSLQGAQTASALNMPDPFLISSLDSWAAMGNPFCVDESDLAWSGPQDFCWGDPCTMDMLMGPDTSPDDGLLPSLYGQPTEADGSVLENRQDEQILLPLQAYLPEKTF